MKRQLLFLALLLPIGLFSQITYQHYLDTTYRWFELQHAWIQASGSPPCYLGGVYEYYFRYHVVGTDSIGGYTWYQVHSDEQNTAICQSGSTYMTTSGYPGAFAFRIREDSAGRIWKRDYFGTTKMMYDFGNVTGVGSTIWMEDYQVACQIAQIDTVYLGPEPRARYWCACSNPQFQDYVVEGVGHSKGFDMGFWSCRELLDSDAALLCVEKDGYNLTLDTTGICGIPAHIAVGIGDRLAETVGVRFLAETAELVLTTPQDLIDFHWFVADLNGRVVMQGDRLVERISVGGVASGLYLFRAFSSGDALVQRFVKD